MNDPHPLAGSDLPWANQTNIHPLGLALVIALGLATLFVPRKFALVPLFLMACSVAPAQRLVIATLDFSLLRTMVLFVFARIVLQGEHKRFTWVPIDALFVGVWLANSMIYVLQWATVSAAINRTGIGFEAIGVYLLARMVIRSWDDLIGFVRVAALTAGPLAVFFMVENQTGRNVFAVFGGVPFLTVVRDGRLRCQGAFSHPIIAGVFWASLMPLFAALWWQGVKHRVAAAAGLLGGLVIIYCCASSTPVLALAAGCVGAMFFPLRASMRSVVWCGIGTLTLLHLIMQAPVWHLISRVSAVGGSTAWYRYHLIDETVNHFTEWALLGVKTTGHWGYGLQDVTNQYILHAVTGGLITLVLFIWLLIIAFKGVGDAVRRLEHDRPKMVMAWAIGVMLFVHCMSFIGVSYFGQANVIWYLSLAIAANLAVVLSPQTRRWSVGPIGNLSGGGVGIAPAALPFR